jgi:hypothetical protein
VRTNSERRCRGERQAPLCVSPTITRNGAEPKTFHRSAQDDWRSIGSLVETIIKRQSAWERDNAA